MEAAKLLEKVSPLPVPPFVLDESVYNSLAEALPPDRLVARPLPSWTFSKKQDNGEDMPQTIAHRGYKAVFPENTMGAFKGAADVETDAIETDVHLTKDDVVVLSHDATLKRCFGREEKIINCNWDEISDLQTLKTPHQHMPRLSELLEFLAQPGKEKIWLLLDIKLDNDASDVIRLIAETIRSIAPHPQMPWDHRIVLGCWAAKYLPLCTKHLPTFPITHIGFSTSYARLFLRVPNVSFNMLQHSLLVPFVGSRFLRDARRKGRPVYTWTVNDDEKMKWCIQEGLDGVVTDDPKRFREICKDWKQGCRRVNIPIKSWAMTAWIQCMVLLFGTIFWWKFGGMDRSQLSPEEVEENSTVLHESRQEPKRKRRGTPILQ